MWTTKSLCMTRTLLIKLSESWWEIKGSIYKKLFEKLFVDGIQLITKIKSNMKGTIMKVADYRKSLIDSLLYFKKKIIELTLISQILLNLSMMNEE